MVKRESIGLQLYSVRDDLAQDFDGTMRRIAAMGYTAVEVASFQNVTIKQAKAMFDTLDLTVISGHLPLPLGEMKNNVLDNVGILGCKHLVCAYLSPDEYFQSLAGIKQACDILNEANAVAQENGLTFHYHNHWWEAQLFDGKPAYQHMMEFLDDSVCFEIDTYWMRVGGLNPVDVIKATGKRSPLIHIKDGSGNREDNMLALGDGVMDFDSIFEASQSDWHIVELDRFDGNMMTAVENSYKYLIGKFDT